MQIQNVNNRKKEIQVKTAYYKINISNVNVNKTKKKLSIIL